MGSIPRKPLRAAYHGSFALLGLTCLLRTADARPMLLLSEQFPGPWLEVTQEIRDVLALNKVSACSQAAGRKSSRNPGEYLLYCTSDEKLDKLARTTRGAHRSRPGPALPRYRTAGRILRLISGRCIGAVFNCSALEFGAGCLLRVNRVGSRIGTTTSEKCNGYRPSATTSFYPFS